MTKQKLAKLHIETACLAHNAGWTVQILRDKQLVTINRLFYDKTDQRYYIILEDHKIGVANNFYLHPKHNEELKPKEGDLIKFNDYYDKLLQFAEIYLHEETRLRLKKNPKSHTDYEHYLVKDLMVDVQFPYCSSETDLLVEKLLNVEIIQRKGISYFPPFEWVKFD